MSQRLRISREVKMYGIWQRMSLIFLAIMLIISAGFAHAYRNEPDEFRGLEWGSGLLGLTDMVMILDGGDLKAYMRKGDRMTLGDAELKGVHYVFYKGQFYCVYIDFEGYSNFRKIRDIFVDLHGAPMPEQSSEWDYFWGGRKASVTLTYDKAAEKGEVGYKSVPIDLQMARDQGANVEKQTKSSAE